jgi:K+-transporting ATPase KdpF subunit
MRRCPLIADRGPDGTTETEIVHHARPVLHRHYDHIFRGCSRLYAGLQSALRRTTVNWDYLITGAVSFFLLIYLLYALLKPERF